MIKDEKILIGKAGDKEIFMYPKQMNRHGLIAGASGTGKTVTLKVIAESLAEIGVPTVIADIKGDLSGMIVPGDADGIQGRLESMGIEDYETRKYRVHFFDVYQTEGHPVRAVMQEMGPLLLSRIMDLTEAQEGILNIIFRVARDMELAIYDLKDLQAMTNYVYEKSKELSGQYGNVSKQSVGAIQRKLLVLEEQGGNLFFGLPALNIDDWIAREGGQGVMNIIECDQLFQHPALYSMFLFWMLNELYENLPEVGDLDKPKIVFFFDEAHLLFQDAPKQLLQKISQTVKLIRSKGVGVFFCTQVPSDIPSDVLGQLSNRIQHSLRAYTPSEIKAAKLAAESFRQNPELDAAEAISNMKTGTALVSVLGDDGAPTIVEKTKILPPRSSMNIADKALVERCINNDSIYGIYEKTIDPDSAYEIIDDIRADEIRVEQEQKEAEAREKAEAKEAERQAREEAKKKASEQSWSDRMSKKAQRKLETELINMAARSAKKMLKNFLNR
ncbi:MAG: DUF853 family protein [Solobacterium sp.]|nr:DUF853 family protein [Solobacterium sp.]MBR0478978.1 DUF853 family protein [Solobacterium sp.]